MRHIWEMILACLENALWIGITLAAMILSIGGSVIVVLVVGRLLGVWG